MAVTESKTLELGSPAPDFALPDTEGRVVRLADLGAPVLVVVFMCNHCPYVKHVAPELARVATDYLGRVAFVGISSNDVTEYPEDAPPEMAKERTRRGYPFPYLYDETQEVARAYDAVCTPDLYVFDRERRLGYHGQLDETRPHRISSGNYDSSRAPAHGKDLRAALDALLEGRSPAREQRASIGCSIKWKGQNGRDRRS
ncbi:MAG: thioredoxin family protein [Polyangiaceae bacterium]